MQLYGSFLIYLFSLSKHLLMDKKFERYEQYIKKTSQLSDEIKKLKGKNRAFIISELLSFTLMIGCVVAYTIDFHKLLMVVCAFVFLGLYVLIRCRDIATMQLIDMKERLCEVCRREVSYMEGDYSCFDAGEQFVNPAHVYTFDLDIFGPQSLFQRINRTVTTGGNEWLAHELSNINQRSSADVSARRETLRFLSEMESQRNDFCALGCREKIETQNILNALHTAEGVELSRTAAARWSLWLVMASITGFFVMLFLAIWGSISFGVPLVWSIVQVFAVSICYSHSVNQSYKIISQMHKQLKVYVEAVRIIVRSPLQGGEGILIMETLNGEDSSALQAFSELEHTLDAFDRGRTEIGKTLFNMMFMNDYFLLRRFLIWKNAYMPKMHEWIDAVSRFDALVSMATFCYNEPTAIDAEIRKDDGVVYEAEGLYHPFLARKMKSPVKAVSNDFCMKDGHYYIVTGANMAGKSTFLRSLGINYVLALNGMPVFASRFSVSLFTLFSSMRTTDDLANGISYFNAELLRLKQLMVHCRQSAHTLIILDEILKGTNSLDKLNGSRLFLQTISLLPVTGIIATHDLELSRMADENPEHFHNFCFEIQLSSDITYTYKITPGVARNQNATYLLKKILNC